MDKRRITRLVSNQRALRTSVRSTIIFTHESRLNDFYAIASRHKAVAHGVKSLFIKFPCCLSAIGTVRSLFPLLINLEDLELSLVGLSRVAWMRLLGSIRVPNLATLLTNAPHDVLLHSLCGIPGLLHITLTAGCTIGSTCPLSGLTLPLLTSVHAPASCVAATLHGNPVEKVVVTDFDDANDCSFRSIVAGLAFTIVSMTSLHLEFNPVHGDVLKCLAAAVPNLGALKLVETLDISQDTKHLERPWKHAIQWGADLMPFRRLHRFLLRSSARVSGSDANDQQEFDLINLWAGNSSTIAGPAHPTLRYITLWTFAHSPQGQLSYWQKSSGGQWTMVGRAIPPTWDAFV